LFLMARQPAAALATTAIGITMVQRMAST